VLASGHRRYTAEHIADAKGMKHDARLNVIYCRESTKSQAHSLIAQVEQCKAFCIGSGITCDHLISEYGSGLNYKRKGLQELIELLSTGKVGKLVVYSKDKLVNLGFELFEKLCAVHDTQLIVIDRSSKPDQASLTQEIAKAVLNQ
jgi:predicted site-specific integrase-resolvase